MTTYDPLMRSEGELDIEVIAPKREADVPPKQVALRLLNAHASQERSLLGEYSKLGKGSDNDQVRFLVDLIVEDEKRHHTLLLEMINTLQADLEAREPNEPEVPAFRPSADRTLAEATKRFIDLEKSDADQLKDLRRQLRSLRDDSLLPLMVEIMEIDVRKHLCILKHLLHMARANTHR